MGRFRGVLGLLLPTPTMTKCVLHRRFAAIHTFHEVLRHNTLVPPSHRTDLRIPCEHPTSHFPKVLKITLSANAEIARITEIGVCGLTYVACPPCV